MDLKSMLPLLMMMNGGGADADMLKTLAEFGKGGGSAQDMMPLFMNMFAKSAQRPAPAETYDNSKGNPDFPRTEPASASAPKGAQFFGPILDFANEKIIYHLSQMLF